MSLCLKPSISNTQYNVTVWSNETPQHCNGYVYKIWPLNHAEFNQQNHIHQWITNLKHIVFIYKWRPSKLSETLCFLVIQKLDNIVKEYLYWKWGYECALERKCKLLFYSWITLKGVSNVTGRKFWWNPSLPPKHSQLIVRVQHQFK